MLTPLVLLLAMGLGAGPGTNAAAQGVQRTQPCTFASLSAEDQRRLQSRYRRRVRMDGVAYAEAWVHEQACMTAEERRAKRKPLLGKDGKPCTKTRLEMRVSPGFDGAMTMSPVPVCAH